MNLKHAFFWALAVALPGAAAETSKDILARMDAAAPGFKGIEASYKRIKHTAIINDDAEESGTMRMLKTGSGVRVLVELTKPDVKTNAISPEKIEVYFPKINTVQEYDLGKQKGLVEQFLLLGFGTSGKDLAKSYGVKVAGDETIDGQPTTRLELTPKSDKVKEYFNKVEVWIPAGAAHAVRQRVFEKSGDTMTFSYENVKLNPPLTPASVELKLPPGAKREFPGK